MFIPNGQLILTYERIVWFHMVIRYRDRVLHESSIGSKRKKESLEIIMSIDR